MPNPMEKMAQMMRMANDERQSPAYNIPGNPMPPSPEMQAQMNFRAMNPMQRAQMVMQAMQNPAQYVASRFPDIPEGIRNDPNQIFQYLQRTRNITNADVQDIMNQIPNQYRRQ